MIKTRDWMTKDVRTITKDDSIQEASKRMREINGGSLIVMDGDNPAGIITERDVSQKLVAEDKPPSGTKVEDIMTKNLISASPEDSIMEVSKRMNLAKIKKMPIMENGKLVGIITTTDLMNVMKSLKEDMMAIAPENI